MAFRRHIQKMTEVGVSICIVTEASKCLCDYLKKARDAVALKTAENKEKHTK